MDISNAKMKKIRYITHIKYILLLVHFVCSDQVPIAIKAHNAEVKLKIDLFKNYSIDVLPLEKEQSPVVVDLAMHIVFIKDLDAKTQTLTTEGWLKMKWNDSRLAWNPKDYAGIDMIRLEPHKIWQPDVELYNSAAGIEVGRKTEVFALLHYNGELLWIPPVTYHSICEVDQKHYPYDKHSCYLKFGSWAFDGYYIDLQIFDRKEDMDLSDVFDGAGEWEITAAKAVRNELLYECCVEHYPDVTIIINLQRRSPFYKVAIMCPLVGAVIFLLVSFWLPPTADWRITLNIISILTAIVLLMHLGCVLKNAGNYCPLIMSFCGTLLQMSAVTVAISITFSSLTYSKKNEPIPEWMRKLLQSPLVSYFCITTSMRGSAFGNNTDFTTNITSEDEQIASNSAETPTLNLWMLFFQLIDRILFVFCLIIITSFLIASST